jgi:hypothetical protein
VLEAWRAPDVSGVSVVAWRIRVRDGLVWAIYGVVATQTESLIFGSTAACLAVGVLVGVSRSRQATVSLHALTRPGPPVASGVHRPPTA